MTAEIREVYCVLHAHRSRSAEGSCFRRGGFSRVATFIKRENAEAFLGKVMKPWYFIQPCEATKSNLSLARDLDEVSDE